MPNIVESLFLIALLLPPLAVVAGAARLAWPSAERQPARPASTAPRVDHSHVTAG